MSDLERFDDSGLFVRSFSRRQALKLGALSLGGAIVSGLFPGRLFADTGGNSDCAHFCTALFPPGPDRGLCVSEAAQGTGVCGTCAPTGGTCDTGFTQCLPDVPSAMGCFCFTTTLGHGACGQNDFCDNLSSCQSQSDCPSGYFCSTFNGCNCGGGVGVCIAVCGDQAPSVGAQAQARVSSGRTLIG